MDSSEATEEKPARTKLLKGKRWPKDRYGDEIDVGDFLMFVNWYGYPMAALGKVIRIGKTGKVHVEVVKIHPRETVREVEIKECTTTYRLDKAIVSAFMMAKLARD